MKKNENKIDLYKKITQKYIKENKPKKDIPKNDEFVCKNWKSCKVNRSFKKQSCVGGYWGDEKAKALIVAESPSGKGIFYGRFFGKVDNQMDLAMPQDTFRKFVMKNITNNITPFFTDVVKCGVSGLGKKDKFKTLNKRFIHCSKYLTKEIKILEPDIIICAGGFAFKKINEIRDTFNKIKEPIILKFTHYGSGSYKGSYEMGLNNLENKIWPEELKNQKSKFTNLTRLINATFLTTF